MNVANTYITVGRILGDENAPSLGRTEEALQCFQRGLKLGREVMALDPNEAQVRYNHSIGAWRLGDLIRKRDPAAAVAAYDEAALILRSMPVKSFSRDVPLVFVLAESTFPLRAMHRDTEAAQRLRDAHQIADRYPDPASVGSIYCNEVITRAEGAWAAAAGRATDAISIYTKWLDQARLGKPSILDQAADDLTVAFALAQRYGFIANAYRAAGRPEGAADAEQSRRRIADLWSNKLPARATIEAVLLR
jgi:hypothetical protein